MSVYVCVYVHVFMCGCQRKRVKEERDCSFLSSLWTVSVFCLATRITTITPTFFNCIFIKPGKYHDVRKTKEKKI